MQNDKIQACLMGALLADAASLGLHWIYAPQRIAAVAQQHGGPAFVPINQEHYKDVPSYFAHGQRQHGELSQYGVTLHLAIQNMAANNGSLDINSYQQAYAATFGAGGSYVGYIDRPTRGTLANLTADIDNPSGVEDDQHPAIARLPALVATLGNNNCTAEHIRAAVELTNLGESSIAYALVFARLLQRVLHGTELALALQQGVDELPEGEMRASLRATLESPESDSVAYGEITERACHLPQGLPLSFHILRHSTSYREAVETNILAGGDSCGRALIIAAVAGAQAGTAGLPIDWLLQMRKGHELWRDCQALASIASD